MSDERLHVRTRGAVTEIEFDHPPINIYDVATRDALCEILTAVIADPGARVLVFTAAGEHFSAGADLEEFGTAPSLFAMRDARWGRDVWGLLRSVPVPMLASMHGNAVGFGFELALQCDLRIAADDCVVALPEARVGMLPAGGASQTLPRVVGTSAALAAVITGERVDAVDALARGFVDEVVPRAELKKHTDARADAIAARPAAAVRAAKAAVWSAARPAARGRVATRGRPRRDPAPDSRLTSPPSLRECPRSRESSVRSRPVRIPRSTTSSGAGSSGRCRAGCTSSGLVPASAATA